MGRNSGNTVHTGENTVRLVSSSLTHTCPPAAPSQTPTGADGHRPATFIPLRRSDQAPRISLFVQHVQCWRQQILLQLETPSHRMSPLAAAQVMRTPTAAPSTAPSVLPVPAREASQPPWGSFCQRLSTERGRLWGPSQTPVGHMARSLPWALPPQPLPETSSKVATSRLSLEASGADHPSGCCCSAPGDVWSRPSGPGVPAPSSHVWVRTAA